MILPSRFGPAAAIAAALAILALLSIWLGAHHSLRAKLIWTAIALLVPILGPLAWFALGQERRRKP